MNVGLSVPLPAYSVDVAAMARVAESARLRVPLVR